MGSDKHYPVEAPAHPVAVDGFWVDGTPVTNRDLAAFVEATGHVTTAEIAPDPADYPGALPELLRPASLVFSPPGHPVPLNSMAWWDYRFDADWRHPLGPDSSLDGLEDHPVIHVSYDDAQAHLVGLRVVVLRTVRSAEHTSDLQSLMGISYAVFCLKKNEQLYPTDNHHQFNHT